MVSWDAAKQVCTPADFERLAYAYLNATAPAKYEAATAEQHFGCKPESFKRQIGQIVKKINEAKGDGSTVAPAAGSAAVPKAKGGRKRKAADEEGAAEPKKRAPRKKKTPSKDQDDDDFEADANIKAENGAGEDEDEF